jgi:hypothetical protein
MKTISKYLLKDKANFSLGVECQDENGNTCSIDDEQVQYVNVQYDNCIDEYSKTGEDEFTLISVN